MRSLLTSAAVLSSLYALVFVVERLPAARFRPLPYRRRYALTDLTWYVLVVGMSALSVLVLRPVFDRIAVGPVAGVVRDLPAPGRFALALVLFDVVSYGVHRQMHRSDLLWNIHKVHHSTLALDGLAATRQHLLENTIRFLPGQLAMFLVGIPTAQAAPAVAVGAAFAVLTHSNLDVDLRMLERLFVTPRLHRRHHVPATAMSNYGGIFTVWDRLCGSFVSVDTTAEERFGCPGEIDTYPQRFRDAVRRPLRDLAAHLRSGPHAVGNGHGGTSVLTPAGARGEPRTPRPVARADADGGHPAGPEVGGAPEAQDVVPHGGSTDERPPRRPWSPASAARRSG